MTAETGTKPLQGLVLSGGGATAAYEIGVMKALLTGQSPATRFASLDPRVVSGTSAGSVNASLFASLTERTSAAAASYMEEIWLNEFADGSGKCNSGAFRIRANPLNFFHAGCYSPNPAAPFLQLFQDSSFLAQSFLARSLDFFSGNESIEQRAVKLLNLSGLISSEPFKAILSHRISFAAIRSSPVELRIAATNWKKGSLAIFSNKDMTDEDGVHIIMASSAIPGVYPSVNINGEPYVDGGVLMNTPLKPAIDAGGNELHIIYMNPDVANIPLPNLANTANDLCRALAIGFGSAINQDIETARKKNKGIAFWENNANIAEASKRESSNVLVEAGKERVAHRAHMSHRPLTIHRYHPSADLNVGPLDFAPEGLQNLINQGFREAVAHSCDKNKCVLP